MIRMIKQGTYHIIYRYFKKIEDEIKEFGTHL